jgi:hypothetical protein
MGGVEAGAEKSNSGKEIFKVFKRSGPSAHVEAEGCRQPSAEVVSIK